MMNIITQLKKLARDITSRRQGVLRLIKEKFPNLPDYVAQDMAYSIFKDNPKWMDDKYYQELLGGNWKQEKLQITLDVFNSKTKQQLEQRLKGENPNLVPRDTERHETQKELLEKGPSEEPIIVFKTPQGYDLVEGWHRTIQSLLKWPDGYEQNAWVSYPN